MSYNVDHTELLCGELWITDTELSEFLKKNKNDIPEGFDFSGDSNGSTTKITKIQWYGEWSGSSIDTFIELLKLCTGEAEILVIWEGGDRVRVFRVNNGIVDICLPTIRAARGAIE